MNPKYWILVRDQPREFFVSTCTRTQLAIHRRSELREEDLEGTGDGDMPKGEPREGPQDDGGEGVKG